MLSRSHLCCRSFPNIPRHPTWDWRKTSIQVRKFCQNDMLVIWRIRYLDHITEKWSRTRTNPRDQATTTTTPGTSASRDNKAWPASNANVTWDSVMTSLYIIVTKTGPIIVVGASHGGWILNIYNGVGNPRHGIISKQNSHSRSFREGTHLPFTRSRWAWKQPRRYPFSVTAGIRPFIAIHPNSFFTCAWSWLSACEHRPSGPWPRQHAWQG